MKKMTKKKAILLACIYVQEKVIEMAEEMMKNADSFALFIAKKIDTPEAIKKSYEILYKKPVIERLIVLKKLDEEIYQETLDKCKVFFEKFDEIFSEKAIKTLEENLKVKKKQISQ